MKCDISFSVLLCVNKFNPWLVTAIESVLSQSDADFEFLISVNACDDIFWNYMNSICAGDYRVKLFRSDIGQLSFNLNFLADQSTSTHLIRMDADDICESNRFEVLRNELIRKDADILGSAATLINANGESIGFLSVPLDFISIKKKFIFTTVFCHPTVVIRRDYLLKMRGYLGGFSSEDSDLWLRAICDGGELRNLSQPLLKYRLHSNQTISNTSGYAEMCGHWLRHLFITKSLYCLFGFTFCFIKCIFITFFPFLKGAFAFKLSRK